MDFQRKIHLNEFEGGKFSLSFPNQQLTDKFIV